jgi:hypothetical protein
MRHSIEMRCSAAAIAEPSSVPQCLPDHAPRRRTLLRRRRFGSADQPINIRTAGIVPIP